MLVNPQDAKAAEDTTFLCLDRKSPFWAHVGFRTSAAMPE
jgi:hypothetical protein